MSRSRISLTIGRVVACPTAPRALARAISTTISTACAISCSPTARAVIWVFPLTERHARSARSGHHLRARCPGVNHQRDRSGEPCGRVPVQRCRPDHQPHHLGGRARVKRFDHTSTNGFKPADAGASGPGRRADAPTGSAGAMGNPPWLSDAGGKRVPRTSAEKRLPVFQSPARLPA